MKARLSFAWGILALVSASAGAQDMRIQFAEPIALEAREGHVDFVAYGRRFDLALENNDRLLKAMPAARKATLAGARMFRGRLEGIAGSWVRLTRVGTHLEGAIWDGSDLYAITTRSRIDANLTTPLAVDPGQTIVYRLSDAIGGLGREFCALAPSHAASLPGSTPLEKYSNMVRELRAQAAAAVITDQIELSLIGDSVFQAQHGANSSAEMLARLNIVDGIFSEQVGLLILATDVRLLPGGTDPFTTSDPVDLLGELANYRDTTPDVYARGLAHLITGRDLTGPTNGIAYLGSVCNRRLGVSLSDTTWGTLTAAQVMAHELGHNLGAEHDGEAGACAGTPQTFLMSPTVNGSGTFSACSLSSMAAVIAAARGNCVVAAAYADASVVAPLAPTVAFDGSDFTLPFTVRSIGNLGAQQVNFTATLPAGLVFQFGTFQGGTCSASGANEVSCAIGTLAPAEQREVSLTLTGAQPANLTVSARVTAANDYLRGNDVASAAVTIQSGLDVGVTMSASAGTVYVNDMVDFTFEVTAYRARLAQGATMEAGLAGMELISISAGANSCAVALGSTFRCQIVDLAPGAHTTIVARGRARNSGSWSPSAFVNFQGDGDHTNNSASVAMQVQDELGVSAVQPTADLRVITGQTHEHVYTLTAIGRLPSPDVRFEIDALRIGTIESVTPSAGSCVNLGTPFPGRQFRCSFGTLSPGDVRTVVVRFRMDADGIDTLGASTIYWNGSQDITWHQQAGIRSAAGEDLAVSIGMPEQPTEGRPAVGSIGISALGINPSQNVVVTLDFPAPIELTGISHPGWTCSRVTPQQGRCSIASLSRGGTSYIGFNFTAPTTGQFQARVSVTADRDAVSANNTQDLVIDVLTFLDVAMNAASRSQLLIVGTPKDVNLTLTNGARPVTAARVSAAHGRPGWEIVSITAGSAACQAESFGFSCNLGDLPANASIPVTVRYNALLTGRSGGSPVCVQVTRDSEPGNNCMDLSIDTYAMTDLRLEVAQASVSATAGTQFQLPRINIPNGSNTAAGVRVRVPIPSFASVQAVASAGGAICVGSGPLECEFPPFSANSTAQLDITLSANSTGTFTSNIELFAANDSTAGNNAAAVAITVTAASSGGSSSSSGGGSGGGGGGGGGRIEWLLLAFLVTLVIRRCRAFPAPLSVSVRARRCC